MKCCPTFPTRGSTPTRKIGYEISFTRHFYQPKPLRTLDEIRADILAVEKEAEGLAGRNPRRGHKVSDEDRFPTPVPPEGTGQLVLYRTEDGRTRISCRFEGDSAWLTQAAIADLFQTTPQNITLTSKPSTRRANSGKTQLVRNTYKFARKAPAGEPPGSTTI